MREFLKEIIKQAGFLAKGYYQEGVSQNFKSDRTDIVTEADKETEKFLIEKILERFPGHGIISEEREGEINPGAEYTWVIDPIDGTRNFAYHIAVWCVMVGVTKGGKPYLGAVYDAMNDELFFAEAGKGAFLNERRIKVGSHDGVKDCFLVFNAGRNHTGSIYDSDKYERYINFFNKITGKTGIWFQNYGTMLPCCYLAAGRADGVVVNSGLYHDYLAPYVICTEARAKWTNSSGGEWKRGEMDIVVANPKLHAKLIELFK